MLFRSRSEVEELRESIAYYRASDGPSIPHLYLGPLTIEEFQVGLGHGKRTHAVDFRILPDI